MSTTGQTEILIVDDSRTQLELLRYLLEMNDFKVLVALNGQEALDIVRANKSRIVISDIVMPVMDGYEMCATIKDDPELQDTTVILLTQLSDPEDIIRGLKARADFYLTKPYKPDYLIKKVQQVVEQPPAPIPAQQQEGLQVSLSGKNYLVTADRQQMLNLLFSTYESAVQQNRELTEAQMELKRVNDQLQAQAEQLRISETNFRTLLDNNLDATVVIDHRHTIRFANLAARVLLRPETMELADQQWNYPLVVNQTHEIRLDGNAEERVAELRVVETHWEGQPAYLASLRDITERKRYEQKIREQQDKLHDANARLRELATRDGLTGLNNHRAFKERLSAETSRAARYQLPISLLLLDADRFKQYNDSFGHPAGDEVLRMLSRLLQEKVRDCDFAARYGGEEFAVILPNTDAAAARILAERIRAHTAGADWPNRSVTVSLGAATLVPEYKVDSLESIHILERDLLHLADKALYQSKAQGRNMVTHALDLLPAPNPE